ncbi:hypothetical protein M378DRAFT_162891, partial [Amanita muscaria Koide BX008]
MQYSWGGEPRLCSVHIKETRIRVYLKGGNFLDTKELLLEILHPGKPTAVMSLQLSLSTAL